jgi:HEAT repeat protein
MFRCPWLIGLICLALPCANTAWGQTQDILEGSVHPICTLGQLIKDSPHIVLLQVESVDRAKLIIHYRKVADLKGTDPGREVSHTLRPEQVSDLDVRALLAWARPGRLAVAFHKGKYARMCLGNTWYWVSRNEKGPGWEAFRFEDSYGSIYVGQPDKLAQHVKAILAGKEVVITAKAPDDGRDPTGQLIQRVWLRGKNGKVWRIKASLKIEQEVFDDESPGFVGWGVGGPEVVPGLAASLHDPDPYERAGAAEALGQLGSSAKAAVAQLRAALTDSDLYVRIYAAVALGKVETGCAPPLAVLTAALRHQDAEVRAAAAAALAWFGPRARPASSGLIAALEDREKRVRRVAACALGETGPETGVVLALARVLRQDQDFKTRITVLKSLGKFGEAARSAETALRRNLREDPDLADAAAEVLAHFSPPAMDALLDALGNGDCGASMTVPHYLGEMGPRARAAIPALMGALKEKEGPLRFQAAEALLRIDRRLAAPEIVEALQGLLREEEYFGIPRKHIVDLLAETGPDPAAVPVLAAMLRREDRKQDILVRIARYTAVEALAKAGPTARVAIPAIQAMMHKGDTNDRLRAARALWRISKDQAALRFVIGMLGHKDDTVRVAAAGILAEIGPDAQAAVPALRNALKSRKDPARANFALALWCLQWGQKSPQAVALRREAIGVLCTMLREESAPDVLEALRQIGPEAREAVPDLARLLHDDKVGIRQGTVAVLGKMAPTVPEAVAPLGRALDDRARVVRIQAALALGCITQRHPRALAVLKKALESDWGWPNFRTALESMDADARGKVPALLRPLLREKETLYKDAIHCLEEVDAEEGIVREPPPAPPYGPLPWADLSAERCHKLWDDLASPKTPVATRAFWTLTLGGNDALPFFHKHLHPAPSAAPERISRLIADLDSDRFKVRQQATAALEQVLDAAGPALRKAWYKAPSLEARRRLERLLSLADPEQCAARRSELRALKVLERIATPEARQLLGRLAKGLPAARLTREARAALRRLAKANVAP